MSKCPRCDREMGAETPGGLCPACLLQQGLASEAMTAAPRTNAPSDWQSSSIGAHSVAILSAEQLKALLPQFDAIEFIGRGGMGVVYKAHQANLDRWVALKVLSPEVAGSPGFAERFAREARAMARLNHPNIVSVYDFGTFRHDNAELCYLTMEFVDGSNLRTLLKQLTPEQALAIVPQICEALQFAHDIGIVHRDIKPENILVDKKGRVKIADFGLAKLLDRTRSATDYTLTRPDLAMGTPSYMAPEQLEHPTDVDHRADLYSLGVVFYEMLTGQLPKGRFPLPSKKVQIDVRLDEVVLKAMEYDRELRYQHASEVRTSLELVSGSQGPLALDAAARSQTPAKSRVGSISPAPRLSRLALAGLICNLPAIFGAINLAMGAAYLEFIRNVPGARWEPGFLVLMFLAAPAMLMGAISLKHIRQSPATLYGLRLAVLDLLLFPLLVLDAALFLILIFITVKAHPLPGGEQAPAELSPLVLLAMIPTLLVLDVVIYWRLWMKLRVTRAPAEPQADQSPASASYVIPPSAGGDPRWFYSRVFLLYAFAWTLSLVTWNLGWPGFILTLACFTGISWWLCRRFLDQRPLLLTAQRSEKPFKRFWRRFISGPTFAAAFYFILLAPGLSADGLGIPEYASVFRIGADLSDANRIVLKNFQSAHPSQLSADVRDLTYSAEFGRYGGTWIGHRPDDLLLRSAPLLRDNFSGRQFAALLARTWVYPSPNPPEFRALPYFWIYMVFGLVLFIASAIDLLGSNGFLFSGLLWKPALRLVALLLASFLLVGFWSLIIASWVHTSRVNYGQVLTASSEFATLDEHGNITTRLFPALDQWAADHGYEIAALTSGKLVDSHRFPVKATPVTYQAAILWKPGMFDRVRRSWEGPYSRAPEMVVQSAGTDTNSLVSITVLGVSFIKAENDAGNALQKDLHEWLKHDLSAAPQPVSTQPMVKTELLGRWITMVAGELNQTVITFNPDGTATQSQVANIDGRYEVNGGRLEISDLASTHFVKLGGFVAERNRLIFNSDHAAQYAGSPFPKGVPVIFKRVGNGGGGPLKGQWAAQGEAPDHSPISYALAFYQNGMGSYERQTGTLIEYHYSFDGTTLRYGPIQSNTLEFTASATFRQGALILSGFPRPGGKDLYFKRDSLPAPAAPATTSPTTQEVDTH